ncbi:MAG: hypothetical protein JO322_00240 [Candidatus Eremiobacteraeota bacterium]|nr:hypothetical protein [Candidatus Eremiobacteraeota bacterium]
MYNVAVERSAGWSGIAFIIIVIVAAFLPGAPPPPDASASDVGAFIDAHHSMWMLAAWLTFPAVAFFLWWLVQLRAYLRLVPQIDDGLPTYMLAGGVVAAAIVIVTGTLQIVLGMRLSTERTPQIVEMLYDSFNAFGATIFIPSTVVLFAASHSGRRHQSLPAALAYFGYLATIGCAIATLSVFSTSGFMAIGGIGTIVIGLLPFAIWVVAVSIVLIRAPHSAPVAGT